MLTERIKYINNEVRFGKITYPKLDQRLPFEVISRFHSDEPFKPAQGVAGRLGWESYKPDFAGLNQEVVVARSVIQPLQRVVAPNLEEIAVAYDMLDALHPGNPWHNMDYLSCMAVGFSEGEDRGCATSVSVEGELFNRDLLNSLGWISMISESKFSKRWKNHIGIRPDIEWPIFSDYWDVRTEGKGFLINATIIAGSIVHEWRHFVDQKYNLDGYGGKSIMSEQRAFSDQIEVLQALFFKSSFINKGQIDFWYPDRKMPSFGHYIADLITKHDLAAAGADSHFGLTKKVTGRDPQRFGTIPGLEMYMEVVGDL